MSARSFEKERENIESVLGVLYRCLALYKGIGNVDQYKAVRSEITLIEKELSLLIEEEDAEIVATKEP
jgi:hypothetical protein